MDSHQLIQTLVDSFSALADEVQGLIDRKTVLEHKLRYAHEQYQILADKYAPTAPDISETLANLQLPPEISHHTHANTSFVPLPKRRRQSDSVQAELAIFIREGRKVAQQLSAITADAGKASGGSSQETFTTNMTSLSTVLEQDFTIEGKKGKLDCPFSAQQDGQQNGDAGPKKADGANGEVQDTTPHHSEDPICAAMFEETMSAPHSASNGGSATKCPIRFLNKHSPEEIANYVEKHKHEIPRSHEVCVRRYQKNEDQIRKLDAKYGNLVSMIKDLSHLHAPMLPAPENGHPQHSAPQGASNERVENWAQAVSASVADDPEDADDEKEDDDNDVPDRESHFERTLKEVRVGESPSRPWGISVPVYESTSTVGDQDERPISPPPAPVRMPSPEQTPKVGPTRPSKCPFDHTKLAGMNGILSPHVAKKEEKPTDTPEQPKPGVERPFTPLKQQVPAFGSTPQPTFINPLEAGKPGGQAAPQMVFTGPVFIGYPIEQAIQFMQHFQNQQ
ncbi:Golgi apparatus membrane protein tvp38 [Pleurostoma richardsiae]|uniref:Golgi apparatus membrane protein tvp38 n=1 Tax=Pleurostoma richardsiae TaxID=41990 RepID=A0AA38VDG0_9PEZI|nr:Golgi apparatus membrane protein tvp38 [Pleurostoma richardsiae]